MKNIFDILIEQNIPHAVMFSNMYLRGTKIPFGTEVCIVACIMQHKSLKNLGFRNETGKKNMIMTKVLTDLQRDQFNEMRAQKIYKFVKPTEEGRIYEWAGHSFKEYYDKNYFRMLDAIARLKMQDPAFKEAYKSLKEQLDKALAKKNLSFKTIMSEV